MCFPFLVLFCLAVHGSCLVMPCRALLFCHALHCRSCSLFLSRVAILFDPSVTLATTRVAEACPLSLPFTSALGREEELVLNRGQFEARMSEEFHELGASLYGVGVHDSIAVAKTAAKAAAAAATTCPDGRRAAETVAATTAALVQR